ncbi:TetR family transcriptional regulator [Rhizobium sp. SJZ105]|uniref:TetR/AcrR family transcriptional regulator n=1 Tax=Rhizobium sp. SJZ105 TaxID=2572678 RepID=UPI0011AC3E90|nr:TetR/AcrR family transcriptional regulator [Rhizobium sp. SJZ105]TWC76437.1 TetR family transcriptional regulator [Rhizobium sp. SJZ105]
MVESAIMTAYIIGMTPTEPKLPLNSDQSKVVNAGARAKLSRTERIRESTRAKLIEAAERTMAAKGVDATTIADITEAADVGTGSFYNHFKTKSELAEIIFRSHADDLYNVSMSIFESVEDAALGIAYIQKTFFTKAVRDPVWGWFVVHATSDLPELGEIFGAGAADHIKRGQEAGRFKPVNIDVAVRIILVVLTTGMRDLLLGEKPAGWAEDIVGSLLQLLGVPNDSAVELSRLPLPAEFEDLAERTFRSR